MLKGEGAGIGSRRKEPGEIDGNTRTHPDIEKNRMRGSRGYKEGKWG